MSYSSHGGGQPSSFKTNVNRAKTKRWVEAKSYSYDGDDWGEVDDYNEYGGYDEPQPSAKPTGLRQRGQSAASPAPSIRSVQIASFQDSLENAKHNPAHVEGSSTVSQNYGGRSTTNPSPNVNSDLARSNSFDHGDERRVFSNPGVHPSISVIEDDLSQSRPVHKGLQQSLQDASYQSHLSSRPVHQFPAQRLVSQDTRLPSKIIGNQQVGPVPQAIPIQILQTQHGPGRPLQTQGRINVDRHLLQNQQSYPPTGNLEGASYAEPQHHPNLDGRTQSMTSVGSSHEYRRYRDFSPSAVPTPLHTRGSPPPQRAPESRPSSQHPPRKSSLSQGNRTNVLASEQESPSYGPIVSANEPLSPKEDVSSSQSDKTPQLVRPADIYKRMPEEKERERHLENSPKSNIKAFEGTPTENEPHISNDPSHSRSQSSIQGRANPQIHDLESAENEELNDTLMPTLGTVSEIRDRSLIESPTTEIQRSDTERSSASSLGFLGSLRPVLPHVSRMSGFGDLFPSTLQIIDNPSHIPNPVDVSTSDQVHTDVDSQQVKDSNDPKSDHHQHHQNSSELTSIVHQAFYQQIPATPSSMAESSVGRSGSGSTSVISPIISRDPSLVTGNKSTRGSKEKSVTPPMHTDDGSSNSSRPLSSSTFGTPRQITRKPSPSELILHESIPPFARGHQRNRSTPSPNNSPARTPVLQENFGSQQPQEAEIASIAPVESVTPTVDTSARTLNTFEGKSKDQTASTALNPEDRTIKSETSKPSTALGEDLPGSCRDSPTKSRVRDLAGKFEEGSGTGQLVSQPMSSRNSSTHKNDGLSQIRPSVDRLESFRPHLPGGWESFTSQVSAKSSNGRFHDKGKESQGEETFTGLNDQNQAGSKLVNVSEPTNTRPESDAPLTTQKTVLTNGQQMQKDAFAALAAAGNALVGAFTDVADVAETTELKAVDTMTESLDDANHEIAENNRRRSISIESVLKPEVTQPLPAPTDDKAPSTYNSQRDVSQSPKEAGLPLNNDIIASGKNISRESSISDSTARSKNQSKLPALTMGTRTHQYESDRLRREIVNRLSSRTTSEPTTTESDSPWQGYSKLLADSDIRAFSHESMVIPSEYESYWNGPIGREELSRADDSIPRDTTFDTTSQSSRAEISPTKPLQLTHKTQHLNASLAPEIQNISSRVVTSPHRYSWEEDVLDVVPQNQISTEVSLDADPSHPPHDTLSKLSQPSNIAHDPSQFSESRSQPEYRGTHDFKLAKDGSKDSDIFLLNNSPSTPQTSEQQASVPKHEHNIQNQQESQTIPTGYSPPQIALNPALFPSTPHDINHIRTNESTVQADNVMAQRRSVHQTKPEGSWEPISRCSSPVSSGDNVRPSLPISSSSQPKVPAFREILAMKNSTERTRAYNETREQFAHLSTGLTEWLAITANELPEHADIFSGSSKPTIINAAIKPLHSKPKILGLRPGDSAGDRLVSGNDLHSSSPGAGSRTSSQQVQSKGKELLHSAGVFGGKANVAAKGLFSKGRSKLRGSGSVDKVSSSSSGTDPFFHGLQPQSQPHLKESSKTQEKADSSTPFQEVLEATQKPEHQLPSSDTPSSVQPDPHSIYAEYYTSESYANRIGSSQKIIDPQSISSAHDESTKLSNYSTKSLALHSNETRLDSKEDQSETGHGDSLLRTPNSFVLGLPNTLQTQAQVFEKKAGKVIDEPTFSSALQAKPSSRDNENIDQGSKPKISSTVDPQVNVDASHGDTMMDESHIDLLISHTSDYSMQKIGSRRSRGGRLTVGNDMEYTRIPHGHNQPVVLSQSQPSPQSSTLDDGLPIQQSLLLVPETPFMAPRGRAPNQLMSRPFSFMEPNQNQSSQQLEESWQRRPSAESQPGHLHSDRPPSPVSPQQSLHQDRLDQYEREHPGHGVAPGYLPLGNQQTAFQKSGYPESSFQDPNLHEHPAFRQEMPFEGRTNAFVQLPLQRRDNEKILPSHEPIRHQSQGSKLPARTPSSNQTKSHRGSRSSGFFKVSGINSKPEETLSSRPENKHHETPVPNPGTEAAKLKRMSLFRSSNVKAKFEPEGNHHSSDVTMSNLSTNIAHQPDSTTRERPETKGNTRSDSTAKSRNRLQRASTSVTADQDPSKKKRFSAIGSLFGRSNKAKAQQSQISKNPSFSTTEPKALDPSNQYFNPPLQGQSPPALKQGYIPRPEEGYYAPRRLRHNRPTQSVVYPMQSYPKSPEAPAYVQDSTLRRGNTVSQPLNSPPSNTRPDFREFQQLVFGGTNASRPTKPVLEEANMEFRDREPHHQSQQTHSPSLSPAHSIHPRAQPPLPPKDDWHPSSSPRHLQLTSSYLSSYEKSPHPVLYPSTGKSEPQTPSTATSRVSLPPLKTDVPAPSSAVRIRAEMRKSRQMEIEQEGMVWNRTLVDTTLGTDRGSTEESSHAEKQRETERERESSDDEIIMSSTSYPGQEWTPSGLSRWEEY